MPMARLGGSQSGHCTEKHCYWYRECYILHEIHRFMFEESSRRDFQALIPMSDWKLSAGLPPLLSNVDPMSCRKRSFYFILPPKSAVYVSGWPREIRRGGSGDLRQVFSFLLS